MQKNTCLILTLFLALTLFVSVSAEKRSSQEKAWNQVKSFGYQLQDLNIKEVVESPLDLLILDYSEDGSHEERWSRQDIARLKQKNQGTPRLLLAYLSIGEAEDYRFYWPGKKKAKQVFRYSTTHFFRAIPFSVFILM